MKLRLEKAGDLKKSIDGISVLVDEAEFVVQENGFSLKATDPSQISMVSFLMPKNSFTEYKSEGEEKIGLDMGYLSQVFGRSNNNDAVELSTNPDKTRLNLKFLGKSTKTFSLPLLDISQNKVPSPKIDFDAELIVLSSLLSDALKDAQLISTHVTIGVTSNTFFVKAESSKGNMKNETEKTEPVIQDFKVKNEAKSMFPLDYLQDMLKATSNDTKISIRLKTDAPIELSYPVGEAKLKYFLAPRIESE